jgi:hypothetical protein
MEKLILKKRKYKFIIDINILIILAMKQINKS